MKISNRVLVLIPLLVTFLVSGCASSPDSGSALVASDNPALIQETDRLIDGVQGETLSRNSGAVSLALNNEGHAEYMLHAEARYFAASGRYCRKVNLEGESYSQSFLACQKGYGLWELFRSAI